jgi:hypothetical protein
MTTETSSGLVGHPLAVEAHPNAPGQIDHGLRRPAGITGLEDVQRRRV